MRAILVLAVMAVVATVLWPHTSNACGCFTPPNPTVPVVQAGERILFAVDQGQVTAHIQVQYTGNDGEFGWLLPLPAVPQLELGSDEVFAALTQATQPFYGTVTRFAPQCAPGGFGFGTGGGTGGGTASGGGPGFADAGVSAPSPLVVQDSVGPYDYAVLRADSKDAMLTWLSDNRYFVPVGTDDAVTPYIRPGAYFLALKLRPGQSSGDLQPVVLRYASEYGVIPIVLTSTGATENMPVQVFMLGAGRAIPRNYHHTVLNDAALDWLSGASNYVSVVTRAAQEAPGHHTFVTEYAGTPTPVRQILRPTWRFGAKAQLASQPTPRDFVAALWSSGFSEVRFPLTSAAFSPVLRSILVRYLPPPPGINAETFFANYDFFAPQAPPPNYQPQAMADEIWERVVEPTERAAGLFVEGKTLTRFFTTLSPQDMNRDPAFSFNPSLPPYSNLHQATLHVSCDDPRQPWFRTAQVLVTEQGWHVPVSGDFAPFNRDAQPGSLIIEVLKEEGPAVRIVDLTSLLASPQHLHGKGVGPQAPGSGPGVVPAPGGASSCSAVGGASAALGLMFLVARSRRRRTP